MKIFDPDTQAVKEVPDSEALELELRGVVPVIAVQRRKRDLFFLVGDGVSIAELYRRLGPRFDALGYDLMVAPYRGPKLPLPEQPTGVVAARPHARRRIRLHRALLASLRKAPTRPASTAPRRRWRLPAGEGPRPGKSAP
jgi:hypothetical protein